MKKVVIFLSLLFTVLAVNAQNNAPLDQPDLIIAESSSIQLSEQDTIYQRNGEKIICTIKELGVTEIKYSLEEYNEGLLFVIGKKDIEKIVFSNGKVQTFAQNNNLEETAEQNSGEIFQTQKKDALKIDFLSLVANTTSLTYERCLKPGRSVEFSIGAVGLGFADMEDRASGILLRGGYKFIRSPNFYMDGMRYAHILKGSYVKLEFDFASYKVTGKDFLDIFNDQKERYTLTKFAFLVVIGKQWVFDNSFVVDLYSGVGVGNNNLDDLDNTYPYGFTTLGDSFPLALSLGLRLGLLVK
ncbi:hypothetical protein ACUNWD_19700 [Sunxiuqinia sp. A32]|uniref:hypothetical protein n=1 Tax=Sunxiuqinia sp. A32 TaxID=3461496 RepID=UPI00404602AB